MNHYNLQVTDEDNESLNIILNSAKEIQNNPDGARHKLTKEINLLNFLPQNRYNFYRYEGSLTTPTCDEVVMWTVFEQTLPISDNQVLIGKNT